MVVPGGRTLRSPLLAVWTRGVARSAYFQLQLRPLLHKKDLATVTQLLERAQGGAAFEEDSECHCCEMACHSYFEGRRVGYQLPVPNPIHGGYYYL